MSIKNKLHIQEYVYDFSVDGGAVSTIDLSAKANKEPLPDKAFVKNAYAQVVTACTSGGAATVSFGNSSDVNVYSNNTTIAVAALTANSAHDGAVAFFVASAANLRDVTMTIGTAALTAGKIVLVVEYFLSSEV